ncbi:MAG: HNH endonuclease [Anaerolineae bacterium]|nr:HNH endonuclease [Anaerolineae bacterium]
MAIKLADAFRLWGRAGARCSICRTQLTPLSIDGVLGEMAHIAARSDNGPRANSSMSITERDAYNNLILLCPTHHTEIDRDVVGYGIERLQQIKREHEYWVDDQIERGLIKPYAQDVEAFRDERLAYWRDTAPRSWCYVAITPLTLTKDAIDPVSVRVRDHLARVTLPSELRLGSSSINQYHIEPSSNGIVVEDFRRINEGVGYRIEVFRTGHAEISICLRRPIEWASDGLRAPSSEHLLSSGRHRLQRPEGLLSYFYLAVATSFQVATLLSAWRDLALPFRDMIYTVAVVTNARLGLHVHLSSEDFIGRPLETQGASFETVINVVDSPDDVHFIALQRLTNAFGLVLPALRDANGRFAMPMPLSAIRS